MAGYKFPAFITSLVLVNLVVFPVTADNASFKDVSEQTAYSEAIDYIKAKDIVQGFGDNIFRPKNTVTRAELLKMVLLSDNQSVPERSAEKCFSDVDQHMCYAKYICYAKETSILNGYPDGSFNTNQPVCYKEG